VYDSNAAILAAAVEEIGGVAKHLGIGQDNEVVLSRLIGEGLASCDMVLMSGGTSKGAGDLCYRAVALFKYPGIVVHGVALKPGKPLCLAVTNSKPVIVLPGFPSSAIFTFHEFAAPVIRAFAGLPPEEAERVEATLPMRVASERGRTEFIMVSLARRGDDGTLTAYPMQRVRARSPPSVRPTGSSGSASTSKGWRPERRSRSDSLAARIASRSWQSLVAIA
jgi:putative molybdopterin biosynthesis protein